MTEDEYIEDMTFDKKIIFRESSKRDADLKIKLDYENITRSDFFRMFITGYLQDDSRVIDFIKEWKLKNKTDAKRSIDMIDKERTEASNIDKILGLTDDSSSIFDIIEDEFDF
jgi:hypothetical protein